MVDRYFNSDLSMCGDVYLEDSAHYYATTEQKKRNRTIKTRYLKFCVDSKNRLPIIRPHVGRLAQLGEHLPYKEGVTGSSPVATTIYF